MKVLFSPRFEKNFQKLPTRIQQLTLKKLELFESDPKSSSLKVHKLTGKLRDCSAFSVNHSYRILFFTEGGEAVLVDIGTHSIYK